MNDNRAGWSHFFFFLTLALLAWAMVTTVKASQKKCAAVTQAYDRTASAVRSNGLYDVRTADGLSLPESLGIEIAGIVSNALGVSCTVKPVTFVETQTP